MTNYSYLIIRLEMTHYPLCIEAAKAIRELTADRPKFQQFGRLAVYQDRDAEIDGEAVVLRRRQLIILRTLGARPGFRVTKGHLVEVVYGPYEAETSEDGIETNICLLRKILRKKLGYDPIEMRRFLGYKLLTGPSDGNPKL